MKRYRVFGRVDLIDGHGRLAAIANAGCSEYFCQVGALLFIPVYGGADLRGIARVFVDLA